LIHSMVRATDATTSSLFTQVTIIPYYPYSVNPSNTHIDLLNLLFQRPDCGDTRTVRKRYPPSEIRRLEYDRHFDSTSGASFHSDHTNLCIRMVQIMTSESPEIFCSCMEGPVGGRGPMNKRARNCGPNKTWCFVLRNVAKGVVFLIQLQ
jgi:hypothetical protein